MSLEAAAVEFVVARKAWLAAKVLRSSFRCTEQSAGDSVTSGEAPCWANPDSEPCEQCKQRAVVHATVAPLSAASQKAWRAVVKLLPPHAQAQRRGEETP